MSVLVLIPARGGSKGLPGKNLRRVAGVSLVGHAVRAAREFVRHAGLDGDAYVMIDTDSAEIAREGTDWGAAVPFLREPALAEDTTSTVDSTLRTIERLAEAGRSFSAVVLLQPTSPLRTVEDIAHCWSSFGETTPSVVAVTPLAHPVSLAVQIDTDGRIDWLDAAGGWHRRQDAQPAYRISGAVYITSVETLRAHGAFVVPGVSRGVVLPAEHSIDVDGPTDLLIAEELLGARPVAPVMVGARQLGGGAPCFIIAEAGVNHNGDAALAHQLVDIAADAGADAVKFQTFDPDRLVARTASKAAYQISNTGADESQYEMLRRLVLPHAVFASLAEHARARGILFLSTAFDEQSVDFLETLGVAAFKIPSGEVTNHPFLADLARRGRPLLLSTGMSTLVEVDAAVDVIRHGGNPPLALFHCVTNYPAAPGDCNLRSMETMRRIYGAPVGWSDHTAGTAISIAAVSAGAELLEKHFTTDRGLSGPDHAASLEPAELKELVAAVRAVESAFGDGIKAPTPSEAETARVARRSLHAARDLPAGHALTADDLVALRPGVGIAPSARGQCIGRVLRVDIAGGEMLRETQLA